MFGPCFSLIELINQSINQSVIGIFNGQTIKSISPESPTPQATAPSKQAQELPCHATLDPATS
jgi:hypothetical protein